MRRAASNSHALTLDDERNLPIVGHYVQIGDLVLVDDPRLILSPKPPRNQQKEVSRLN